MEAFLKTGKVGAGAGGSKPLGKEKKEKKQAPVSDSGFRGGKLEYLKE